MSEKKSDPTTEAKKSHQVEVGGHIGNIRLLENGAPPYELRIDREGRWFHEGIEIVRDDIRNFFCKHLVLSEDGSYCVRIGRDECPVIVEDAPFVVVRVTKTTDAEIVLLLNDGSTEPLDARTIKFGDSNVPYCQVRSGFKARFSRPAYYQLAAFIQYDETNNRYFLVVTGKTIVLEI